MSARDVVDIATDVACGVGNQYGGYVYKEAYRDTIELGIRRLIAGGYRLIGPRQLDRETIERCVSTILEWTPLAQDNCDIRIAMRLQDAAAALRSLKGGEDA